MTTLYRPVLIESAEQAEALLDGTVAHRVLRFESIWETLEQPEAAVKVGVNAWRSTAVDDDAWDWINQHLVGWTALVPVEAEEELVERSRLCQKDPDVLHRYVTGWRPYTAKERNR